jgi:hypothetical protein
MQFGFKYGTRTQRAKAGGTRAEKTGLTVKGQKELKSLWYKGRKK